LYAYSTLVKECKAFLNCNTKTKSRKPSGYKAIYCDIGYQGGWLPTPP